MYRYRRDRLAILLISLSNLACNFERCTWRLLQGVSGLVLALSLALGFIYYLVPVITALKKETSEALHSTAAV